MDSNSSSEKVMQATWLFMATNRRHHRVFNKLVSDMQISNFHHRLLMYLYHNECAVSQTEIARAFEVSKAAIAAALKNLEKHELIHRCSAIEDNRYNEIEITEKGYELIRKTDRIFLSADMAMFHDFSPEELDTFTRCLEKMRNSLGQMESGEAEMPAVDGEQVCQINAKMSHDRRKKDDV